MCSSCQHQDHAREAGTSLSHISLVGQKLPWHSCLLLCWGRSFLGRAQLLLSILQGKKQFSCYFSLPLPSFSLFDISFWMISFNAFPRSQIKKITKNHPPSSLKRHRGALFKEISRTKQLHSHYGALAWAQDLVWPRQHSSLWQTSSCFSGELPISSRLTELDHSQERL